MYVPEVKAGSSWRGWEGEEELHRCNPDWEGRWVGLLPVIDSSRSHERTARRGLQSAGQEKKGVNKHTHKQSVDTQQCSCTVIHTVVYGCEGVTGIICGAE